MTSVLAAGLTYLEKLKTLKIKMSNPVQCIFIISRSWQKWLVS